MMVLFKLLSFLPLVVLHAGGGVLGWLVFLFSPIYRQRFMAHVRQAQVPGLQRLAAIAAAGKVVAELPRLWWGQPVPVQWLGAQHIDAALARGKGLIFLTPHLGCFEITAQAYAARYGQAGCPITVLFRPARKAWLESVLHGSRTRPGLLTAPTTLAGVKKLLQALKKGQCVGLLPDQVPPRGQGVWATFFGRDAYTMTLSARLALQTQACVLLAWGERLTWGRGYVIHVQPMPGDLSADIPTATQQINHAMQALVQQAPGQYLWAYARYKQPRDTV